VGISPASLKRADVRKISTVEIFRLMRYNKKQETVSRFDPGISSPVRSRTGDTAAATEFAFLQTGKTMRKAVSPVSFSVVSASKNNEENYERHRDINPFDKAIFGYDTRIYPVEKARPQRGAE
jgi:hypothetical protein